MTFHKTKVAYVTPEKKFAAVSVIIDDYDFPVLSFFLNTKDFTVGQDIQLSDKLKVSERTNSNSKKYFVFEKGESNFRHVPEFYNAKTVYISDSGRHAAVSVIVNGNYPSVLAFFPRKDGQEKDHYVDVPTNQKVVPVKKPDGSVFYFLKPGICNFIIAPPMTYSQSDDDVWTDFDQAREDHYEEMGNSVCEYCGDYHCDCQRNIDEWDT